MKIPSQMVGLSELLTKTLHKSAGTVTQEAVIKHPFAYTRENFLWHRTITLHSHGSIVFYYNLCSGQNIIPLEYRCRDADTINNQNYQGKHHLLATYGMELCLDASSNRKLTAKEFNRGSFSPCKWDANQVNFNSNS